MNKRATEWFDNPANVEQFKESHRIAKERIANMFIEQCDALEYQILSMKNNPHFPQKFRFKLLNEDRNGNPDQGCGVSFTKFVAEVSHCGEYFLVSPESSDTAKIVVKMGELQRLEWEKRLEVFKPNKYRKYKKGDE
jgi:hypothetical protein